LADDAPTSITALGNLDILHQRKLAIFCSVKCPGTLILQTYDLVSALRDMGITVISGFHSPIEKECLTLLLRGTQPIIICPARSLQGMRIPTTWDTPLAEGRLLNAAVQEMLRGLVRRVGSPCVFVDDQGRC
jgi:hypothetical protein